MVSDILTEYPTPAAATSGGRPRWSLQRWVTAAAVLALSVSLLAIVGGAVGIIRLADARSRQLDVLDPATKLAQSLSTALLNQETGVRGYAIGGQADFLEPFIEGRLNEQRAADSLRALLGLRYPRATADLDAVVAASERWHSQYALPTVQAVQDGRADSVAAAAPTGKALFDEVRRSLDAQAAYLDAQREVARVQLEQAAESLVWISAGIAVVLLAGVVALVAGLRWGVARPVMQLSAQVRAVSRGDFDQVVQSTGPDELARLGRDVDSMRRRIVSELAAIHEAHNKLDAQAQELRRSNSELEQFAYVASHDLQEPLRKVASFCQILETRYHDQLDERGRKYIEFAVDGATRMQTLINDLLTFSRVGRLRGEATLLDGDTLLGMATANLTVAIEESHATITADPLPRVYGDASLLAAVFQNLIGNAIKFRREDQEPKITVTVRRDGANWLFTCSDNGIGIEAAYAERIFTIFQRLHPKGVYGGTGIGLALCRKIIEYHDGKIWLDTSKSTVEGAHPGSTFCFTLPVPTDTEATHST